jgi:hypothetical protein
MIASISAASGQDVQVYVSLTQSKLYSIALNSLTGMNVASVLSRRFSLTGYRTNAIFLSSPDRLFYHLLLSRTAAEG